jgi:triphosphatase
MFNMSPAFRFSVVEQDLNGGVQGFKTMNNNVMEIELKLAVTAEDRSRLYRHPLLTAAGEPKLQDLSARYFDTPDLALRKNRIGMRVRKADGQWTQTVKAGGRARAGLHERHEWEDAIESGSPDGDRLEKILASHPEFAGDLDVRKTRGALQDIFAVRVHRATWLVEHAGTQIEVAIDEGTVSRPDKSVAVSEVELELKSGSVAGLYEFALKLMQDIPMHLQRESKAERGYALIATMQPRAIRAQPLKLSRKMSVEQGMQRIFENCLDQVAANEAGVLHDNAPEPLHQMRVGLRRFRSALRHFRDVAPFPPELESELAWLGALLGEARDWDVLSHSTLPSLGPLPEEEINQAALNEQALRIAAERRSAVQQALNSPRYAGFMLAVFSWMLGKSWRQHAEPFRLKILDEPLLDFAQGVLRKSRKQVQKRGTHISGADTEALHRLRIAVKRSRYATEFFSSLGKRKSIAGYSRVLSSLQEELGRHNDDAIGQQLLKASKEEFKENADSVSFIRGYLGSRLHADRRKLKKLWKGFHRAEVKWRGHRS